jgi:hypothetical protein
MKFHSLARDLRRATFRKTAPRVLSAPEINRWPADWISPINLAPKIILSFLLFLSLSLSLSLSLTLTGYSSADDSSASSISMNVMATEGLPFLRKLSQLDSIVTPRALLQSAEH